MLWMPQIPALVTAQDLEVHPSTCQAPEQEGGQGQAENSCPLSQLSPFLPFLELQGDVGGDSPPPAPAPTFPFIFPPSNLPPTEGHTLSLLLKLP